MISYKLFFRGVYWINAILSPFHLCMMLVTISAYPDIHDFEGAMFRMLSYFLFALGSQIISLVTLMFIAKLWDFLMIKIAFNSKNMARQGLIFSAIVNGILLTIIGNIYIDNLFAFKHGDYFLVFMPLWALVFYYLICYLVGNSTHKPKWLT